MRRISAEVKSDSLMGTEHTLEDFYGFSGRPLEWDWVFWGPKKFLTVHALTKWDDDGVRYGGPDGWLNDDIWQIPRVVRGRADSERPAPSVQERDHGD